MKILLIFAILTVFFTGAYAQSALQASKDPIKIESDELTLLQKEQKGIFVGNVEVVQGKMVVDADKMVVYYDEDAASPLSAKTKNKDIESSQSNNKISKIETFGNVVITTSTEKAKGDTGEYNVREDVFVLLGKVVLTQGGNVLTGSKFIYNRRTGKGILTSEHKRKQHKERAKALIIPEQLK